jgi:intergrase/recombinase
MKALSTLSKFLGLYEDWQRMIRNNGLKWNISSDDIIIERLTRIKDSNEVFEWIKQVKAKRPDLSIFVDFMAISGLRFCEAIESYNLIVRLYREGKLDSYYSAERKTLEHFRFKEIFIRNTKKAFISFIPKHFIETVSHREPLSETIVQNRIRRQKLKLRFSDIREMHGTLLTKFLNASEIDFLHGRVSSSVFMRNYFNPNLVADLRTRTFKAIAEIEKAI